jgi:hypothetical protein
MSVYLPFILYAAKKRYHAAYIVNLDAKRRSFEK